MPAFTDTLKREWLITIDAPKIQAVRGECQIDLAGIDGQAFQKLHDDPYLLVNVLWVLCRQQRPDVNATQFGEGLVGDPIEQAIGPDPFKPTAFRVWTWEDIPGQFPAAVVEAANNGATARYSVVSARGGPANLDDLAKRHEPKPAWDNIMVVDSAATIGLNFKADFARAAILFQQPYHEQPIQWFYGQKPEADDAQGKTGITKAVSSPARPAQIASLKVSRENGEFQFTGGGLRASGSVSAVTGLSGDAQPARNLRGKNVAVTANAATFKVKFSTPEADADYAIFLEQSWLGTRAITDKTSEGFTITFDKPAPANAKLDWMLVR